MSGSGAWSAEGITQMFNDLPSWGKAAVGAGLGLAFYIPYKYMTTMPRKSPYKENYEPNVVYLYQFPRSKNLPNMSTYCLKLETWLRMSDIPYEIVPIPMTLRSREGTLPFVELNGKEYCDSALIIRDLATELHKPSLEDHLSAEQKATSRAFEKLVEMSLGTSILVHKREHIQEIVGTVPAEVIGVLAPLITYVMKSNMLTKYASVLTATGYGKHDRNEAIGIGSDDLRAISAYLGNKHYFIGFKPTKIDACLFAFLATVVFALYENEHLEVMKKECPNLLEFVDRVKTRFWPDWIECTTKFSTDSHWKKKSHGNSQQHSPRISNSSK